MPVVMQLILGGCRREATFARAHRHGAVDWLHVRLLHQDFLHLSKNVRKLSLLLDLRHIGEGHIMVNKRGTPDSHIHRET